MNFLFFSRFGKFWVGRARATELIWYGLIGTEMLSLSVVSEDLLRDEKIGIL